MRIENYIEHSNFYPGGKCCICGSEPVAVWAGCEYIYVCADCAVTVLPALIADAVYRNRPVKHPFRLVEHLKNTLSDVIASFWKAAAIQAIKDDRDYYNPRCKDPEMGLFDDGEKDE